MEIDIDININLISGFLDKHIGIVFFTLWLIVAAISLKQRWDSNSWKIFWIALGLLCLASSVTALYWHFFAPIAENDCIVDDGCNLANDYNLHRNLAILFFGIFAGGLAIWARVHNEKQIKNSLAINRNDRYARAVELLEEKTLISNKGGLYILRDLINEADKTESLRYSEAVADWLESGKSRSSELIILAKSILG